MLFFDKTKEDSFNHIKEWNNEVNKYSNEAEKLIVGNKNDQVENEQVDLQQGIVLGKDLGIPFMEASALTGFNVEASFEALARRLIEKKGRPVAKGVAVSAKKRKKVAQCCNK